MNTTDRWDVHFMVKSLDIRYSELVSLLAKMRVQVHKDERGCQWISKADFRQFLLDAAT